MDSNELLIIISVGCSVILLIMSMAYLHKFYKHRQQIAYRKGEPSSNKLSTTTENVTNRTGVNVTTSSKDLEFQTVYPSGPDFSSCLRSLDDLSYCSDASVSSSSACSIGVPCRSRENSATSTMSFSSEMMYQSNRETSSSTWRRKSPSQISKTVQEVLARAQAGQLPLTSFDWKEYIATKWVKPAGHRVRKRPSTSSPILFLLDPSMRLLVSRVITKDSRDWGKVHSSMFPSSEQESKFDEKQLSGIEVPNSTNYISSKYSTQVAESVITTESNPFSDGWTLLWDRSKQFDIPYWQVVPYPP